MTAARTTTSARRPRPGRGSRPIGTCTTPRSSSPPSAAARRGSPPPPPLPPPPGPPPPPKDAVPTARIAMRSSIVVGGAVLIDGARSTDPEGRLTGYAWDVDRDGRTDSRASRIKVRYRRAGRFTVRLAVTDAAGQA